MAVYLSSEEADRERSRIALSSNGVWGLRPQLFLFLLSFRPLGREESRKSKRCGVADPTPRYLTALFLLLLPLPTHAASVMDGTKPWPNATVTYRFAPELLKAVGSTQKDCTGWSAWRTASTAFKACKAMDAWHWTTGITFRADNRLDSLNIVPGTGTSATLGHLPAGNTMHIEAGVTYGSVLHEFGHVLGLMHEHQRPDRNDYLALEPFLQTYLDTCGLKLTTVCLDVRNAFPVVKVQMSTGYDPCSLMHYLANQTPRHREDPRWSRIFTLTAKGQAALDTCLPQFANREARCRKIGQKCAISSSDAALVRRFHHIEKD